MRRLRLVIVFAAAPILIACASQESPAGTDGTWVGTITTEGNVTTVVNESGSVWGGTARLVEEASIGVEAGADEYMFGQITGLAADDRHIYVLETRPPVVRVYGLDGTHIRNIGRRGQGPGEFAFPESIVAMPDGRLMVRDDGNARINFFSVEGELIEEWQIPGGYGTSTESFATADGTLYSPQLISRDPETNRMVLGVVAYGPDGEPGEAIPYPKPPPFDALTFARTTFTRPDGSQGTRGGRPIPFSPRSVTSFSPVGATIVGTSDRYRLEINNFEGGRLVIERVVDPVPVQPEEAAWTRRFTTAFRRRSEPNWTWNGPDIPEHKGFLELVAGDSQGRVWVSRNGLGIKADVCDENPEPKAAREIARCWESTVIIDVFGADGRFLGSVATPPGFGVSDLGRTFIKDDLILIQSQDDAGTIMVKRYRLVLAGEE